MTKKILFIYTNYSTFVDADFEILASEHKVTKYRFKPVRGFLKNAVELIKQTVYLLSKGWKFDVVFIWFADYHSFMPVLFAKVFLKKSIVVVGGYDVANIPELRYGSLSSPLRKTMTLFSLKNATLCLAVVGALEEKIKAVCRKARTKTLYTGYEFLDTKNAPIKTEREKIVLTVSITNNYQRMQIKGLDRFRELAEKLPDFRFILIGANESAKSLFNPVPENLELLPPLPQNELASYYAQASFYTQFSRSEGLPNALCEGMLYGCIPIGTRIGGIPAAIGNTAGLVLDCWDANVAASYIRNTHNKKNRELPKARIEEKFDLRYRKEKLLNEI